MRPERGQRLEHASAVLNKHTQGFIEKQRQTLLKDLVALVWCFFLSYFLRPCGEYISFFLDVWKANTRRSSLLKPGPFEIL